MEFNSQSERIILWQTETDDVPMALMAFQGRLVAGIGKSLRLYDMGKKKLLRKVENKVRFAFHPRCTSPDNTSIVSPFHQE